MYSPSVLITNVKFFFFNDTATTEIYTLSLHDALPINRTRPNCPGKIERSLFGIVARPRNVPVERSSRLSRKFMVPSCEGLASPVSETWTGFGFSRELGR